METQLKRMICTSKTSLCNAIHLILNEGSIVFYLIHCFHQKIEQANTIIIAN